MAYADFKDFNRGTTADEVLRDKAFNTAKNPKLDGYQRRLTSMFINLLIKKLQIEQLKKKLYLIKN